MRRPREHSRAAILEGLTSILPDRCWTFLLKKRENFVADGKPHKVIPCEPLLPLVPPSPAKAQLIVSADLLRRAIKHDLNFDKKFFGFSQRPSVSVSVSQHTLYKVQLCETAPHRALGGICATCFCFQGLVSSLFGFMMRRRIHSEASVIWSVAERKDLYLLSNNADFAY